jgi:peptidoglycan/LPS O-acetylase OafA/YrhL
MAGSLAEWQRSGGERYTRLDGLRGIAISAVMLYHLAIYNSPDPIARVYTTFTAMGWSGVDLFFVLSGFLITGILLRQRGSSNYFRAFYARRVLRIFPLYYAFLALFLIVFPWLTVQSEGFWSPDADRSSIWYWLYLSNIHVSLTGKYHHYFLGVTWTLAIEEQFYLIWPLVVYLCPPRRLAWVCASLVLGALLFRGFAVHAGASGPFLHTFTLCRMDTLAMGALLAIWGTDARATPWLERGARFVGPIAGGIYLGYVLLLRLVPALQPTISGPGALGDQVPDAMRYMMTPFHDVVGYSLLVLFYGSLLVWAVTRPAGSALARLLEWRPLARLGLYSYSVYLFHLLGSEIGRNFFEPRTYAGPYVVAQLGIVAVALAVTIPLALLTWNVIEAPALSLRRYFPYRS